MKSFFKVTIVALVILFFQIKVLAQDNSSGGNAPNEFDEFEVLDEKPNEPPYVKSDEEKQFEELPAPAETSSEVSDVHFQEEGTSNDVKVNDNVSTNSAAGKAPEVQIVRDGQKQIQHPNASKGLYLIDRTTGNYYYKTKVESKKDTALSLRFGAYDTPDISSTVNGTKINFTDVYPSDLIMFMADYEWQPLKSFGKLGVQIGTGILIAQGNGFLTSPSSLPTGCTAAPCPAKEEYTFLAIPLNLGVVYRFEYMDRQWFAPFVAGGGTYYGLAEIRDDGNDNKFIGSPAAYGAAGAMLNISAIDKETGFTFDREYGISNLWLTLEYRVVKSLNEDLDMSSNTFSAGVTLDY